MVASAERTQTEKRRPHSLTVDSRSKITISGIIDVGSFNDQVAELITDYGGISIKGRDLHVKKVSLDTGDMSIDGSIDSIEYTNKRIGKHGGNIFARIFR